MEGRNNATYIDILAKFKSIRDCYPSIGNYDEIYGFFKGNPNLINYVSYSGTTLIETAISRKKYDLIKVLVNLGCHVETCYEGYNLIGTFFKECFDESFAMEPRELLDIVKKMMDNSSSEWNEPNESGITCVDRVKYSMTAYPRLMRYYGVRAELVRLLSMSMKDWHKEKVWGRRKSFLHFRKISRSSMGRGR